MKITEKTQIDPYAVKDIRQVGSDIEIVLTIRCDSLDTATAVSKYLRESVRKETT